MAYEDEIWRDGKLHVTQSKNRWYLYQNGKRIAVRNGFPKLAKDATWDECEETLEAWVKQALYTYNIGRTINAY